LKFHQRTEQILGSPPQNFCNRK